MLLLVGLLSLGLISFFQGVFQPSSSSSSKNVFSQADVTGLLSVEKASADAPYSQSYYQSYYQDYYEGYYEGYYQGSYDVPGPDVPGPCPSPDGPCPGPK